MSYSGWMSFYTEECYKLKSITSRFLHLKENLMSISTKKVRLHYDSIEGCFKQSIKLNNFVQCYDITNVRIYAGIATFLNVSTSAIYVCFY